MSVVIYGAINIEADIRKDFRSFRSDVSTTLHTPFFVRCCLMLELLLHTEPTPLPGAGVADSEP